MDPQACLERIADADSKQEIREACEDLATWIKRGGFQPEWNDCVKGSKRYDAWSNGRYQ